MFEVTKAALLVIDVQKGFLPTVTHGELTVQRIQEVIQVVRSMGLPIIFSQEMHRRDGVDFGRELDGAEGVHCLEGTEDVQLADTLQVKESDYRIIKRRYSCFFSTDLDLLLRGLKVNSLIVCGFLTDVCVHYTCVDAHQHDYAIKVVRDGVSGSSEEAHQASLRALDYLQSDSVVTAETLCRDVLAKDIQMS